VSTEYSPRGDEDTQEGADDLGSEQRLGRGQGVVARPEVLQPKECQSRLENCIRLSNGCTDWRHCVDNCMNRSPLWHWRSPNLKMER